MVLAYSVVEECYRQRAFKAVAVSLLGLKEQLGSKVAWRNLFVVKMQRVVWHSISTGVVAPS
jgi:hypothetical protein